VRIDVRPSSARFVTRTEWLDSRHCFSYGAHYDPGNVGFGTLVAHNDDVLEPGGGFADHPHRGVEIVTWMVSGALRHTDDHDGGSRIVHPGTVQRLRTGAGVVHSEVNASENVARYIQMWLMPDDELPAAYDVAEAPAGEGEFALIASGTCDAPISLCTRASLLAGHFVVGDTASLPAAAFVHLYLIDGAVLLGDVPLLAGDAARVIDGTDLEIAAAADSQLLVWAMESSVWRPQQH
jgi:redox-sensitive bicupin YhaK (pirin superfamily)